ncbi:MAG: primosomal protein N' [Candidatus Aureabacteria bacterium]|nr:primosomal protein N' [Candidatus Auribacterota bacterium]
MNNPTNKIYAQIAVDRYVDSLFDYEVPEALKKKARIGARALIDFRGKKIYGLLIELATTSGVPPHKIKPVLDLDEDVLFFDASTLSLARWISEYYCAPLGMVLRNIVPSEIRKMKKKGLSLPSSRNEEDRDIYLPPLPHVLNEHQKKALDSITRSISERIFKAYLLHGITGSGKTEVYIRAIQHAREKGLQCIVIVPEIALTPQMIETFRTRFTDVAPFHSRLTGKERRLFWLRMKKGITNIVIGARSAVFAPFENLGLIIVDEEHERTFKQGEIPFYNARDVAVMRGKLTSSCVVLGSATPSLESFTNCQRGKYTLLSLPSRVDEKELPEVRIVDMNHELRRNKGKNPVFSSLLLERIESRLLSGEQVILFLNRRGYSTFICCSSCGWIARCENCSITLTFHKETASLCCHRCDHQIKQPKECPSCKSPDLKATGTGTEKVERYLGRIFPEAKIGRMDTDMTRKKDSFESVLENFRRGKTDILVGTQMIAKGLDLPNVTLVGIVAADLALNLPDFRAAEHTFQLITQVAGRTNRGSLKGEVVLQTFSPELPVILFAARQDYISFYEIERKYREELRYPPALRFINVCFRGTDDVRVARFAHDACRRIRVRLSKKNLVFKGPHPSPIRKLNKFYRWNMIIGCKDVQPVTAALKDFAFREAGDGQVVVDVDPLSLL